MIAGSPVAASSSNVLQVAGVYDPNVSVAEAFEAMEPHVVDLAVRQLLADRTGRAVVAADLPEPAVTGACVQAAAALTEVPAADVAASWGLGDGYVCEPDPDAAA